MKGTITGPEDEAKGVKWDRINVVILSWILASLFENISTAYIQIHLIYGSNLNKPMKK